MNKKYEDIRKAMVNAISMFQEAIVDENNLMEQHSRAMISSLVNDMLDFCKESDMCLDELAYSFITNATEESATDETETEIFELEANVFVVPNSFRSVDDMWEHQKPFFDEYLALNDIVVEEDEKEFVEVWMTNDDSNNIGDHGITLTSNKGNKMNFAPGDVVDFIPLHIINHVHEGDTFTFTMPSRRGVIIKATLTAKQLEYRYSRFGKFEDVISRLSTR